MQRPWGGSACHVRGITEAPVAGKQSEWGWGGEGEGRVGWGQVLQGHMGRWENSGFYPEGGGSPGGLWAEERQDVVQVISG